MRSLCHVTVMVIKELVHERFFYLLLFFSLVAIGFSLLLGQMTYTDRTKLSMDFMLGAIQVSLVMFSVFMGISLIQREIASGTISMLLSKPLSRAGLLLGKFCGQICVLFVISFCMLAITLFAVTQFGEPFSVVALIQCVSRIFLEAVVMVAIAQFFAVSAGAIMAAISSIGVFLLGHLGETIENGTKNTEFMGLWGVLRYIIPDLEIFNIKTLASYGYVAGSQEWLLLLGYTMCMVTLYLSLACLSFSRKDIVT